MKKLPGCELDFYAYQIAGTDVCHDPALRARLVNLDEMNTGMTVYCAGLDGDHWEVKVIRIDGNEWWGVSRSHFCQGKFHPRRFADVRSDDISGWVLESAAIKDHTEEVSYA